MGMFKYAGTALENGKWNYRASNRSTYGDILRKEGRQEVNIIELPKEMTKEEARDFLKSHPDFQTEGSQLALNAYKAAAVKTAPVKEQSEAAVKEVKPKAAKTTKAAPKATVEEAAPVKGDDEIEKIRQKNMAVLKQVAKKKKSEAEAPVAEAKDMLPKFLQK